MKITKFIFLVLIFPIVLFSSNLEKVSVQFHWKHQFQYAGFYAALKNGYYKELGLDVHLKEWNPSINRIEDLIEGKVDFAVSSSDALSEILKNDNLIIVSSYLKRTPVALAVKPDIYFPSDLKNRKIMAVKKDIQSAVFYNMWKTFGVDSSRLDVIPHKFSMEDFINGEVDAVQIYTTDQMYELASKEVRFNILDVNSFGVDFYDLMTLTSSKLASSNSSLVLNFKEATKKGWKYALENKEEIVDFIYENFNTQNKTKEALLFEARRLENLILPKQENFARVEEERLKKIALVHLEMNNISEIKDISKSIFSYKSFDRNLNLTKEEKAYLLNKKIFNICSVPSRIKSNKKTYFKSIDKKIIEKIAKKLDVKINFVQTFDWDESLEKTVSGQCDIISVIRPTKHRKKQLNFIEPYYIAQPLVMVTTRKNFYIEDFTKLKNKKVAILHESIVLQKIKKLYPNLEIIEVEDPSDAFKMVKNEKVLGYLDIPVSISHNIKQLGFVDLKIVGSLDIITGLTMATTKNEKLLKTILEKSMNILSEEYVNKLINEWYSIKYEKGVDYSIAWKTFIAATGIILLLIYWNQNVRKTNLLLKEAHEELVTLSITDRLTKLYNRHKIDDVLESEFNRYKRYKNPFGIILIDVDYFKSVNDTYGHHIGDMILVQIANILKSSTRSTDIVGRWGGEEFLIICPETNKEDIVIVAQKCRKAIEKFEFSEVGNKTASFGVSFVENAKSVDDLIVRADEKLYKAKNEGRNRVIS